MIPLLDDVYNHKTKLLLDYIYNHETIYHINSLVL